MAAEAVTAETVIKICATETQDAEVEVHAQAEFGLPGEPARSLRYRATVEARARAFQIRELMLHTDRVAEVQDTLRKGMEVLLEAAVAKSVA